MGLTTKNYNEKYGIYWTKNNGIFWLHSSNGYMTAENYIIVIQFVIKLKNTTDNVLFIDDSATGHMNKWVNRYIINAGYFVKRVPGGGTPYLAVNDRPRLNGYIKQQIRRKGRQIMAKYASNFLNVNLFFFNLAL